MQKKIRIPWLTIIIIVANMIISFNLACSKKTEQAKKQVDQLSPSEEQRMSEKTVGMNSAEAKKHVDLAIQNEEQKMPEEAIKEYQKAIQLDPNYAGAHYYLGALYHKLNAFTSAIGEYEKVLQIDPKYPGIHTAFAHVYYVRGINAWVRAIKLDQLNFGEADTLRQLPYKDKSELTKLIDDYQNSLKADTTDALTYSKLSQAYYILAVDEYKKGIQANPSDTGAILYMALTFSEQGYPQKAMAEHDILQKVDPRAAGVLLTMLKQKEKEKQYYEEMRKRQK